VERKSKLYKSEISLSKELFDDLLNIDIKEGNLAEIENRICHLKTFSNLVHRRYARMLYIEIKNQLSDSKSKLDKTALNKLAKIIELKIGTPI
jgi:hypothetical protein